MQKSLAIIFAFFILFQSLSFEVSDVANLDILIEHAQFHKKQYGDSFFQFMAEHYGNAKEKHQGDHKHDNLPFKHDHQMCSHYNSVFTFIHSEIDIKRVEFVDIPRNFLYRESHSIFEKFPLLQPPKHA
ncbi:hypothetical protein [Formosa sp. S-31]|uniref:hypothetical protein n=1 Tax=Formosa sp. S-31 TaxID=2790949 RepID=UPI003EBF67E6